MLRNVFFVVFIAALALGGAVQPCYASTICAGFLPSPCAPQDTAPRGYSPSVPKMGPTGNVGAPFINDFGEREVRLTDANTVCGGSTPPNYSFMADSSAEAKTISMFDPNLFSGDGGYHILIDNVGGARCIIDFDSKTFAQVAQVDGVAGSYPHGFTNGFDSLGNPKFCTNGLQSGCIWSNVKPTKLYATNSTTQIVSYDLANDAAGVTNVYNFSSCPNLPAITGSYITEFQVGGADRYFMLAWGGIEQGQPTQIAAYDATTGNCYWFNTQFGTVGGTGLATTTIPLVLSPPSLTAANLTTDCNGTGGTGYPDGTYYAALTWSADMSLVTAGNTEGESTPSSLVPLTVACSGSNNGRLIVSGVAQPANPYALMLFRANQFGENIYVGTTNSAGALHLQTTGYPYTGALGYTCAANPCGSVTLAAAPLTTTQVPPTINGAGYNIHNAQLSPDGLNVRVDYQPGYTLLNWAPFSAPAVPYFCAAGAYCTNGHFANGYKYMVNEGFGANNDLGWGIHAYGQPSSSGARVANPPNFSSAGFAGSDSHVAWSFNSPNDDIPFIVTDYASYTSSGDGTQGWSNPASKSSSAYDREVYALAPSTTTGRAWRFAHTRASFLANPTNNTSFGNEMQTVESPDGRIAIFGTNWGWYLGNNHGSAGTCPAPGSFCRIDVFAVELK